MSKIKVISHILPIVHGGYDDAAAVTLWIDEGAGKAHLLGHSGSHEPLDGPEAPEGVPMVEVTGTSGRAILFEEDEIEGLRSDIEDLLQDYEVGGDNQAIFEEIESLIDDIGLDRDDYSEHDDDKEDELEDEE
jgi:hypothetical protein